MAAPSRVSRESPPPWMADLTLDLCSSASGFLCMASLLSLMSHTVGYRDLQIPMTSPRGPYVNHHLCKNPYSQQGHILRTQVDKSLGRPPLNPSTGLPSAGAENSSQPGHTPKPLCLTDTGYLENPQRSWAFFNLLGAHSS